MLLIFLLSFLLHLSAIHTIPPDTPFETLIWSEEFDGDTVDRSKWKIRVDCEGGGNNELQCYTSRPDNVFVKEGLLTIRAIPEHFRMSKETTREYTSGRIHGKIGWTYGYFEARARLPKGKHLWPAIWMMSLDEYWGAWPRSGEIDIMEFRGQEPTKIEHTIHYGALWDDRGGDGSGMQEYEFDFSQDFHLFGLEWTEKSMRFFVDDKNVWNTTLDRSFNPPSETQVYDKNGTPFDKDFYWILNLAVGGGYFPGDKYGNLTSEEAIRWEKPFFEIDYLRVYKEHKENSTCDG